MLDSVNIISNNFTEVDVKITNGKIKLTNVVEDKNVILIGENSSGLNYGCNWIFSSTLFESDSGNGFVGRFISSVTGGTFYHTSSTGPALNLVPNSMAYNKKNIYRDITAISNSANAIEFLGGGNNTLSICINCKGTSYKYDETTNYAGIVISGPAYGGNNRLRLNRCLGENLGDESIWGVGFGIMSYGKGSKVIQSIGESRYGSGIYTEESDLIHCTGDKGSFGSGSAFFSLGGSVLRRCTSGSNLIGIGFLTSGLINNIVGDKIENCNFTGSAYCIYTPTGDPGNYINIYNTTLRGFGIGVLSSVSNYRTKIINSTIIPKYEEEHNFGPPDSTYFMPIYLGGTGSYVINNVLEGNGNSYAINPSIVDEGAYRVLISGNTCINTYGVKDPLWISQGMSVGIDSQNIISGQPI